ncbi:hypothetical protein FPV67DRAFT_252788 [Lyophyllum atratum]|nr:hypothetical protein FPV67DRAFT_252788 [Lyophyllum atratum]
MSGYNEYLTKRAFDNTPHYPPHNRAMEFTSSQYSLFKDSIAKRIISHPETQRQTQHSSELDDFSSYLASESWPTLPESTRTTSYETHASVRTDIDTVPLDSTSASFIDTLISYGFASDHNIATISTQVPKEGPRELPRAESKGFRYYIQCCWQTSTVNEISLMYIYGHNVVTLKTSRKAPPGSLEVETRAAAVRSYSVAEKGL